TSGSGIEKSGHRKSLYSAMTGEQSLKDVVVPTAIETLWVVPADKNLAGIEIEFAEDKSRAFILKRLVEPIREYFHFLIIDCPPSLGILTINGLTAADSLLIPIQCEYFALEGVAELFETLARLKRELNPNLKVEGLLLTMYDERTNLSSAVAKDLRDFYGPKVLKSVIPRNVRLAEAPSYGEPILLYDPKSRGAASYLSLAKEIMANG
ncbi:MAG: AAA family ATPase, partial [Blastocatellia bacterium]|nr:AAA family ATPase [Blastocatellia bacterium]